MKYAASCCALLLAGVASLIFAGSPLGAQSAPAVNAVTPGDFVVDPQTLINLGFEWLIDGDANRSASVDVSYRKTGETAWRQGLPLVRLNGERVRSGRQINVTVPNMFAGSILDLEPGTSYDAQFVMKDPDGVRGEARKMVTVRTRAEPMPSREGRTYHVYPHGFRGEKMQPAFEGLMCAYNLTCSGTDYATIGRPRVKPGDTLLVHAGLYKYNRYEYTTNPAVNSTQPLDGTYYLTADGTADKPIAIRAAGDGEVIFDGAGNFALFDVRAADYTYFEGITIRNAEYGILAGTQFLLGSKGLTVKHCRFEQVGAGVWTNYSGSSNFYIADNTFIGRDDPDHVIGWSDRALWEPFAGVDGQAYPPAMASYVAVKVYGPGHVVAYNYVANFHDGIDIETYGNPDGSSAEDGPAYPPRDMWHLRPVSIDFYNNVMTNFHDNPFEIDGGLHNIRVMRNLMLNAASHAFCNQPSFGGPTYWIRNIAYHLPGGAIRLTGGSAGVFFYNNTILSEIALASSSNVHFRNNLILGEQSAPALFAINTLTNYSSSDSNGFRPNPGAAFSFAWNSPPSDKVSDYTSLTAAAGQGDRSLEPRQFQTLADYARVTGQDRRSVLVDYDVFLKVPPLNAQDRATVQRVYKAEDLDFRLRAGSSAVDAGTALPNVTDGFSGRAPDLGALELNSVPPHYGPR